MAYSRLDRLAEVEQPAEDSGRRRDSFHEGSAPVREAAREHGPGLIIVGIVIIPSGARVPVR